MMKNFYSYFSSMMIIFLSVFSLMLNNMFFIWLIMEITNLIFLSSLAISKNMKISVLYFFISFISSSLILTGILFNNFNVYSSILMMMGTSLKLGIIPFNAWFNFMFKSINFMNAFLLMTFMKLIPFILLMNSIPMKELLIMITLNLIVSPLLMLNKNSLMLMMSFSSIYQTSLMMTLMYLNLYIFILYFIMYSVLSYNMIYLIMDMKLENKMEMMIFNNKSMLTFSYLLPTYMFIPPMGVFSLKWLVLENLVIKLNGFNLILSIVIVMSSLLMIWNYLNSINNNLFNKNYSNMFLKYKYMDMWILLIMTIMVIMFSIMYIYFKI